jgi:hypothetical protein
MNADGARLKCNREKPCQNCTARDERITCKYKGSKNGMTPIAHQDEHGDPMQQRIDHLEGLVKRLIAQRQEIPPNNVVCSQDSPKPGTGFVITAVASDASAVACSAGTTVIDGVHSVYKGADDWYDVLQEVSRFSFFLLFSFRFLTHSFASYGDTRLIVI